jgi:hypothetical protein
MVFLACLGICAALWTSLAYAQAPQRGVSAPPTAAPVTPTIELGAPETRPSDVNADSPAPAGAPVVSAVRATEQPLIDGRLDDRVWEVAARIDQFVQRMPREGEPATEETEVLIAYDSDAMFFGIRVHYSDIGLVRANRGDRDQLWNDDTVQILFDPFLDQQRAYTFAVNGYGVQGDALVQAGGGNRGGGGGGGGRGGGRGGGGGGGRGSGPPGDTSWDALFDSAAQLNGTGWTAEMSIPFKSLRYPGAADGAVQRWGFQIQRSIQSKNETVVWAPVSRDIPGLLRQLGTLTGLQNLSSSRNFEIQPTATAVHAATLDEETGARSSDRVGEGGVNVKYGITPNMTLDATFNPDFSQIESDRPQIETNQRFPLFFSEQRPFFLEGQEAFNVQSPVRAIHTRTIVDPRYGAKITGKMGRTLLGFLVADDEAPGKLDDPSEPGYGQTAQIVMGRARYDLYPNSYLGAVFTDREFADTFSRLGGVDGTFQFGLNRSLDFTFMTSSRRGPLEDDDEEDDAASPGAHDLVDRAGNLFNIEFQQFGRNLRYSLGYESLDPEFGTDLGFVRRTDTRQVQGEIGYRFWPESWILNWGPSVDVQRLYDHEGVEQEHSVQPGVNFQFANNVSLNVNYERGMERYEDIDFGVSRLFVFGGISASRRISFNMMFSRGQQIRFVDDPFTGTSTTMNASVTLRPISRLQSEVGLTTSRFINPFTKGEEFDVKILRALTTFQFSQRMLVRNITQYDTDDKTFDLNLLMTYRVNAGTAFYVGYDDHYQQGERIDPLLFPNRDWQRTNRAVFTKLQYLFRY